MKPLTEKDEIKTGGELIGYLDLMDKGDVKLTIADVLDAAGEMVEGRPVKSGTYALTFVETPNRKLLIQGRKKKHLMRTFGKKKSDLVGKVVTLYADPSVKFGGKEVGGIKFRGQE